MLVTRPEPGATDTAARLDALGFRAVLAPAIRIRTKPARLPRPDNVAAILVTSGHAIAAIPAAYRRTRLFAVGDATAAWATKAGFTNVASAGGDASDLCSLVGSAVATGATLLLITGLGLGHSLASSLRAAGFAVLRRSVYAQVPVRRLPPPALAALRSGELHAALFFSADSAAHFAGMLEREALCETIRNADAVAISQGAAVALEGLPWRRIFVAARPDQDAMLALLR